jgi:hypothetical protein
MAESVSSSSTGTLLFQGIIAILGLVGLYYLYTYLFVSSEAAPAVLLSGKQVATTAGPITIPANNLPPLFTGGEFSISTWINVNNINTAAPGKPKSILRIGGTTFDTIRIYLGGQGAQLMIRFDTGATHTLTAPTGTNNVFNTASAFESTIPDPTQSACDILQIDMQRWIHLVVSVNGMSCDVYMDGKLVRSCPLPNYFNIDGTDYSAILLDDGLKGQGGFGGYISTTAMYGQALSPDVVYRMYMAGPEPITNIWSYLMSFFSPTAAY